MTNLQLFADGDDGGSGTGDGGGTGAGTGAKSTGASGNEPMSFDNFLKLRGIRRNLTGVCRKRRRPL